MRGTLLYLAVLAMALLVCIGILVFLPAQASGANGCVTIGEVGSVSVAHCVDDANGREMYVSSNGFITLVED